MTRREEPIVTRERVEGLRRPEPAEAHVWVVRTARLVPHAAVLRSLSGVDRATLGPQRPERELGRGFLRVLLGRYLDIPVTDVNVERRCPACGGPHGPPTTGDLRMSVSYTCGAIAYAVALSPVGIDIELLRHGLPWRSVAPLVLPPEELEGVHGAHPSDRNAAFLRAWTRREAMGKLAGTGLLEGAAAMPPSDRSHEAHPLAVPPPYLAAIACSARRLRLRMVTDELPSLVRSGVTRPCAGGRAHRAPVHRDPQRDLW